MTKHHCIDLGKSCNNLNSKALSCYSDNAFEDRGGKKTDMQNSLIIIPAHNEEACIRQTLEEIQTQNLGYDILVINDGSSDLTAHEVARAGVDVVNLPFNVGYGVAVESGFKYAIRNGYSQVILLDADGQHDPACIKGMVERMKEEGVNVVIGSRFLGKAEYKISNIRRLGIFIFQKVVQLLTKQCILDITSGFQVIDHNALVFLASGNYPVDYPDSDVILDLLLAGFKVLEVPVVIRGRKTGMSMHSSKFKNFYYIYKMVLALLLVVLRHKMKSRSH